MITFANARLCIGGKLSYGTLSFSEQDGLIHEPQSSSAVDLIDMSEKIISPGFLELQANGMLGFHFSDFDGDKTRYADRLREVSQHLASTGVTSFWATVPTVHKDSWCKILPNLRPRPFETSAELLGAHVEGPYLAATKKGAHDDSFFLAPEAEKVEDTYGASNLADVVKLVTIAPELSGSGEVIEHLRQRYDIRVSVGHSSATFEQGMEALARGATSLTHMFNAMNPAHHRDPGLVGLLSQPKAPFFSIIADGLHVHPAMLALAFRMNPARCMLITDSIELRGLPDGVYPGNAQITRKQRKSGGLVTFNEDPHNTMVGSCCSLDTCVQTLLKASRCTVAEAVLTVTESISAFMGLKDRGMLEQGKRADFVILDNNANVQETWISGRRVWSRS